MEYNIKHRENLTNGTFLIEDNTGVLSELSYRKLDNDILVIDDTQTKRHMEGKGLASKLLEQAVIYAKENNYKIDPLCPFAEVKFDQNQEYKKVQA